MPAYTALLRGINLGPARKLPMAALREVHEGLGHREVATYIQSGNVVFATDDGDEESIVTELESALRDRFGMEVPVVLRTAAELASVVEADPFGSRQGEPRFVQVTFLDRPPELAAATRIDASAFAPDEFTLVGREIHQVYPNGMGRSKLPAALEKAVPGLKSTTRNWRTVTKLLEMCSSIG